MAGHFGVVVDRFNPVPMDTLNQRWASYIMNWWREGGGQHQGGFGTRIFCIIWYT